VSAATRGGAGRVPRITAAGVIAMAVWLGWPVAAAQPRAVVPASSPLVVETIGIEPTVAMTGDILIASYRLRFPDLIAQGKEMVVIEDRMAPDKLPLAPFEAVGLDVEKQQIGPEHVWEFRYRLRMVGARKDVQTLRSFTFFYLIRDVGQKLEDARVLQAETAPLEVRYVTTITGEPVLDIRDPVELGSFASRSAILRGVAWLVAPLPLLLWTAGALRAARRPVSRHEVAALEARLDVVEPVAPPPTLSEARRALIRQLRLPVTSDVPLAGPALLAFQREVVISLRNYLLAEVPSLNPGDTAKDIRRQIERVAGRTRRGEVLKQLAARLVTYQTALERGEPVAVADVSRDGEAIEVLVGSLRWQSRLSRWASTRLRS
jgi:hypothetical protein